MTSVLPLCYTVFSLPIGLTRPFYPKIIHFFRPKTNFLPTGDTKMSYTDSQIMAKLRKVRDKATDELVRIVCDGKIPVDKKGGWNGYSKCMHAMSGVGQEIVRQLQIEEIKRENAQVKNSTNIKIGWKEYSEDEENDSAPN